MTRPTRLMLDTLRAAQRDGGEIRRTTGADWPASPSTLAALVRRGWLERTERRNRHGRLLTVWAVTDAGRLTLNPPPKVRKDTVSDMRSKGKARSRVMVGGVWTDVAQPEPEKQDVSKLRREWQERARERHDAARPKRAKADDMARRLRAA